MVHDRQITQVIQFKCITNNQRIQTNLEWKKDNQFNAFLLLWLLCFSFWLFQLQIKNLMQQHANNSDLQLLAYFLSPHYLMVVKAGRQKFNSWWHIRKYKDIHTKNSFQHKIIFNCLKNCNSQLIYLNHIYL